MSAACAVCVDSCTRPPATWLSRLAFSGLIRRQRLSAAGRFHPLEVAEDGPRIHAQVFGGLGAGASVPVENFVDGALLPLVARVRERQDGLELLGPQSGLVGAG